MMKNSNKIRHIAAGCVPVLLLWLNVCSFSPAAWAETGAQDALRATSQIVEQLADTINPAVVEIEVKSWEVEDSTESSERAGYLVRDHCIGSGILLTSTGEILTNHHVIRGAQQITIHLFSSNKDLSARIVGDDPEADLALLKIEGSGLPHFELEKGSQAKQGQIVLAFGSPYGLGHSVTLGIVSSPSRELDDDRPTTYIQTDAPLNPGASGGPLVDLNGNLLGINTLIYTSSGGNEGVGFALPIETVRYSVARMDKYGSVRRPSLGVYVQPLTEALIRGLQLRATAGLLVDDVALGGPAARSGIQAGDVILSMNGISLPDLKGVQQTLNTLQPGESAVLDIERNNAKLSVTVEPEYAEPHGSELLDYADISRDSISQLGIIAVTMNAGLRLLSHGNRFPDGAVVAAKYEGISSSENELQAGDIIHRVNGHLIHDAAELRTSLLQAPVSAPLILQIERDGRLRYIAADTHH
jgi:serine protease Do